MDNDKNGSISVEEFQKFFRDPKVKKQLNIDSEVYEVLFELIDQNKNGKIDYMEFIAATIRNQLFASTSISESTQLIQAFQFFDIDNTGFISKKNLKQLLV